jgi:hypothetical protein
MIDDGVIFVIFYVVFCYDNYSYYGCDYLSDFTDFTQSRATALLSLLPESFKRIKNQYLSNQAESSLNGR